MTKKIPQGFTLIELLISVAIIGLLAAVAISYYGDYIQKGKCTEGRTEILQRSTALGKCLAIYGAYNNANCNINLGTTSKGNFELTLVSDATTYTLTATAADTGTTSNSSNPYCKTITINQLGVQGGTGTEPW